MIRRLLILVAVLTMAVPACAQNLIKKGTTDVTRYIVLVDSATGQPETGYTITDLDLQYTRNRTAPAAKVDAVALAATDTAHTDNRAIQVDATSSPGVYRVDWPDAAFATGADKVILAVTGTGLHPAIEEVQLVDFDPADGVRLGLTALPNAAAEASGGLYTRGTGAGQINQAANGMIDVNTVRVSGSATAADNQEIVYSTDFSQNYNDVENAWAVDVTYWLTNAASGVGGIPDVNSVQWAGAATATNDIALLSQLAAANFAAGAIDANAIATAAIQAAELDVTGSEFTAIPWNPAWDAEVQSEVQDAIEANFLHMLLAAAYNPASEPGNASALLNVLVENDGGVPRFTTNSLEQAPAGGGGGGDPWLTDLPAAGSPYSGDDAGAIVRQIYDDIVGAPTYALLATSVDNTKVVPSRVAKLGRRADGVTVATPTIRLRKNELLPVWIDCSEQLGGSWLQAVDGTSLASSAPAAVALVTDEGDARVGVNREYAVIWLQAVGTNGQTSTITCDVVPRPGQTLKVKFTVQVKED